MKNNDDGKVVHPPRFRVSRASDLRRYFAKDALMIRCRQDIQGAIARGVDEVGVESVREILKGVESYLEMIEEAKNGTP